jgi:hypothetical protein
MAQTTTFLLWTSRPAHRSYTMFMRFLQQNNHTSRAGDGMPAMGQNFPYVLPDAGSDRRWCLRGIQLTLLVRLAARISSRALTSLRPVAILPFFMRGGASTTHDSLLAKSSLQVKKAILTPIVVVGCDDRFAYRCGISETGINPPFKITPIAPINI